MELKAKNAQASQEDSIKSLMAAVRKFGRFPREHHRKTEDPKLEEERQLARSIRDALQAARLPPAF
eukprot:12408089-Karenia_brevis.AAC.1